MMTTLSVQIHGHSYHLRPVTPEDHAAVLEVYCQCEDFLALVRSRGLPRRWCSRISLIRNRRVECSAGCIARMVQLAGITPTRVKYFPWGYVQ